MSHMNPTPAQEEVLALIAKQSEELRELFTLLDKVEGEVEDAQKAFPRGVDRRWLSIGRTHCQEGLAAMRRAVMNPDVF